MSPEWSGVGCVSGCVWVVRACVVFLGDGILQWNGYFWGFSHRRLVVSQELVGVLQRVNLLWLATRDREIYGLGLQDAGWPMQGNGAQ